MVFSLFLNLLVQFAIIDTHLKSVRGVDNELLSFLKTQMSFNHVLYHYSPSNAFSNLLVSRLV